MIYVYSNWEFNRWNFESCIQNTTTGWGITPIGAIGTSAVNPVGCGVAVASDLLTVAGLVVEFPEGEVALAIDIASGFSSAYGTVLSC